VGATGEKEKAEPQEGRATQPFWREKLIILVCFAILVSDQVSKRMIVSHFEIPKNPEERVVVIKGFFDLVYRTNPGAAFSLFQGKKNLLALISILAVGALIWFRHHFDNGTRASKMALGLMLGGILGNLIDRIIYETGVVDFVRIYIEHRSGGVSEWPAFNIADSAICVGVAILIMLAWSEQKENGAEEETEPKES
jgi:signal peptidase II